MTYPFEDELVEAVARHLCSCFLHSEDDKFWGSYRDHLQSRIENEWPRFKADALRALNAEREYYIKKSFDNPKITDRTGDSIVVVGGIHHGRRMGQRSDPILCLLDPVPLPQLCDEPAKVSSIARSRYTLRQFRERDTVVRIYALDSMSDTDALLFLIERSMQVPVAA